ncbi:MAG: 2Fe-2S iron-sulfur cluster binding domain-containing protein [Rhizobiales bacterium]|nr:2Fe-2S iron-sulfur cluster binding domain-containing protein [Hyphomicrobiales bacterium]
MSAPPRRLEQIARSTALVSGLVLLAFAAAELCNDAIGLVSLEAMGDVAAWRTALIRSWPGTALLFVAFAAHVGTTLWFVARRATLRMPLWDGILTISGILVPVLLLPTIVDTSGARVLFGVDDDSLYRLAKLWPEHAFFYVILIVLLWGHGCLGLHQWLKLRPRYASIAPVLGVVALALPIAAVAGLVAAARVVSVLMADENFAGQVRAATRWPTADAEDALWRWRLGALAAYAVLLLGVAGALTARFLRIVVAPKIDVTYVNGPTLKASTGPTLLEISRIHGVLHADACGGRGRCKACSVRIEQGEASLPPRSAAELEMLGSEGPLIRLGCQIRPSAALTVTRLTHTADAAAAEPELDMAGIERQVAALCVQLQDQSTVLGARRAYDAIFLLNEFLDMVHAAVKNHNGWVARVTGSGIIAVFGRDDTAEAACRSAATASADIDVALDRMNEKFAAELGRPIAAAMALTFGTAYLGRIGAGSPKPLTAIGPVIDAAIGLASLTEARGNQFLSDPTAFQAGGLDPKGFELLTLTAKSGETRQVFATNHARLALPPDKPPPVPPG